MPDLFAMDPKPETSMMRKIMALIEYDRNYIIIYFTTAGLQAQMGTSTEVTQCGSIEVSGTKSISDSVPDGPQTNAYVKKLKAHIQHNLSHKIGLRPLAMEITKLLRKCVAQVMT